MSKKSLRERSFCDFGMGITDLRFSLGGGTLMAYLNFDTSMSLEAWDKKPPIEQPENVEIKRGEELADIVRESRMKSVDDLNSITVEAEGEDRSLTAQVNGHVVELRQRGNGANVVDYSGSVDGRQLDPTQATLTYMYLNDLADKRDKVNRVARNKTMDYVHTPIGGLNQLAPGPHRILGLE